MEILFTTSESIRATVGLDADDVPDSILQDQNLDLQMQDRLTEFLPAYEDYFAQSEDNERNLILWCQYYGALQLISICQLGIPEKFQANNDIIGRFQVKFDALAASLLTKIGKLELKITNPGVSAGDIIPVLISKSVPNYNPITG